VEDKISEDNELEVIEPHSISPKVIELVADSPEGIGKQVILLNFTNSCENTRPDIIHFNLIFGGNI
jgi:hypothetical protein